MLVLNREQIEELIEKHQLVSEFVNLYKQLTPNGFDVTLKKVFKITGSGCLDFSNNERKIPESEEIVPVKRKPDDEHGWWYLDKGIYKVKSNENFKMPLDLIAIAMPRSSLNRMGATVFTGFWDAGFEGKAEFLLNVMNEKGIDIKENARIIQLVFLKMDKTKQGYDGIHKHLK